MSDLHLWIRSENRPTEQRVPIVPADAARLIAQGVRITVEESPTRVVPLEEFVAAGCAVAPAGSWVQAPHDAYVVGIKELPEEPADLVHPHIYFAHAFKGQDGSREVLERFARGGGELLDVEFLTTQGRRVVAFGHWAGYVGASLGVLAHRGALQAPLHPLGKADLDALLRAPAPPLRALVIGARGRSGRGAVEALEVAGAEVTRWGLEQTRALDKAALLQHDLLVNCVVTTTPQPPFVQTADLTGRARRLRVVADVTCDVTSTHNMLPVNTAVTTWADPVRRVHPGAGELPPLDVIAIDNLPSLLPLEASAGFSAELTPLLGAALVRREGPWAAAEAAYRQALDRTAGGPADG